MTRLSPLCLVILLAASRLLPTSARPYERSALDAADSLEQELRQYEEAMVEKKELPEATDDTDMEVESSLRQRGGNGCRYSCKGRKNRKNPPTRRTSKQLRGKK
ncbi:uncharacterized protein LOC112565027 [Pomacea canaliculata]|uniref:uncharacterized protein LOC112565027 n=1 Tax=Pomacea canaliculata TaxID=400727 RepID=UPI000D729567|nr:uncharacterized protein LOC112565027 [Pomacea canaliculata]